MLISPRCTHSCTSYIYTFVFFCYLFTFYILYVITYLYASITH